MAGIEDIAAIVLAAGLSRRYGTASKLHADFRGEPLAHHIVKTIATLPFAAKIAVCRFADEELMALCSSHGFRIVVNPDSARGLSSSLALGIEAAEGRAGALVCLADMPNVSRRHLEAIVDCLEGPHDIVASATSDHEAAVTPPVVFGRARYAELMSLQGDKGARGLLSRARRVVASADELADFDTPADFARA